MIKRQKIDWITFKHIQTLLRETFIRTRFSVLLTVRHSALFICKYCKTLWTRSFELAMLVSLCIFTRQLFNTKDFFQWFC